MNEKDNMYTEVDDYTRGFMDADDAIDRKIKEPSYSYSVDYSQGDTDWDRGWNARLDMENLID